MKILLMLFLSSSAFASEFCFENSHVTGCLSSYINNDVALTEVEKMKNDNLHRAKLSFFLENMTDRMISCEVSVYTSFSRFNNDDATDGCNISDVSSPRRSDQKIFKYTLKPYETKNELGSTPGFDRAFSARTTTNRPSYCEGSTFAASCLEGCPQGEIEINGQCEKGCKLTYGGDNYLIKEGGDQTVNEIIIAENGKVCSSFNHVYRCSNGQANKLKTEQDANRVLIDNKCVPGCFVEGRSLRIDQKYTTENRENFFAGRQFGKEC